MMNASQESNEFVEPAPRPSRSDPSAAASNSRATLSSTTATAPKPRIELLSDGTSDVDGASSDSPTNAGDRIGREPSAAKQISSTAPSSSKAKPFLKSSSPDVPLRIHLPRELDHTLAKKLQIAIRTHGGVIESRLAKANLVVVDPKNMTAARKLLRESNQVGEPIPVVTPDYINDSVTQGARLDVDDPKYKFQPNQPASAQANLPAPAPRTLNGRNPFTDADRQAIISYFIDKDEAKWSLNAAAKELAERVPTHSFYSFQTYLQNNFDKGWNLRKEVRAARRDALDGEPSQLQARILRSQYTPEPGPSEQSAPSDGWPRTSPRPRAQAQAPGDNERERASDHSGQSEEDEPDLQVRQPNPGATTDNVEKSPSKIRQPVEYATSESSSAGTSPPPSISLAQRDPISGAAGGASSDDEESDPDEYSPRMMKTLLQPSSSRPAPSQKSQSKPRAAAESSDSSVDSELDQLDDDSDEEHLAMGRPEDVSARADPSREEESESPEWEGSRRLDSKMRQATSRADNTDKRVKFTQEEKDALLNKLVDHVMAKGSNLPPTTQDAIIAKPEDTFWDQFAAEFSKHSAASWRSHYLKNRSVYKEMIDLMILDRVAGQAEDNSDDDDDDLDVSSDGSGGEAEGGEGLATEQQPDEHMSAADPAVSARSSEPVMEDQPEQHDSLPHGSPRAEGLKLNGSSREEELRALSDGVVVLLPPLDTEEPVRRQPPSEQQWPEAPPPPPVDDDEDEEEDMLQVEAEIDAPMDSSASPEKGSTGSVAYEVGSIEAAPESVEHQENNESTGSSWRPSVEPPTRTTRSIAHIAHRRSTSAVQAGTPVLAQHRDAPFYDFTMDNDEEQRIRKARSRPSLPNLQTRREQASPRLQRSPITTDRVLGHFATPSRSQKPAAIRHVSVTRRQDEEDRIQRTRRWASSVSQTSASVSPNPLPTVEPVAITESSRSRASRINHKPLLGPANAADETPSRVRGTSQSSRRISGGRAPAAMPPVSPTPNRSRTNLRDMSTEQLASRPLSQVARMQYRAEVEQYRQDFGLDNELLRTLLERFNCRVREARAYTLAWLDEMYEAYGVEAEVAFEYVKTSKGNFEQAENFLRLAPMTRSGSTPNRSIGNLSRSLSHSTSPLKRRNIVEERSFARPESSKRYRR